jgi:hypothetical protein
MGGVGLRGPTRDPHKATLLADWWLFNRNELPPHCPESRLLQEPGIMGFVGDW